MSTPAKLIFEIDGEGYFGDLRFFGRIGVAIEICLDPTYYNLFLVMLFDFYLVLIWLVSDFGIC